MRTAADTLAEAVEELDWFLDAGWYSGLQRRRLLVLRESLDVVRQELDETTHADLAPEKQPKPRLVLTMGKKRAAS